MSVQEKVAQLLADSQRVGNGCFIVIRCGSQESLAHARDSLTVSSGNDWDIQSGASHRSLEEMVRVAQSVSPSGQISLWTGLPGCKGADEPAGFYDDGDTAVQRLLEKGGARVVCLVDRDSMQALAKQTPVAWKRKTGFLAWPEAQRATPRRPAPQPRSRPKPEAPQTLEAIEQRIAVETNERQLALLRLDYAVALGTANRLEECRQAATQAARVFRDTGALEKLAETYELLASTAERLGSLASARDWMTFALEAWTMVGHDERIAEAHGKKGHLHYLLGDSDTAAKQFQLAIARDEAQGRTAKVAAGLRRLGLMAEDAGRVQMAYRLYKESMDLVEKLGDRLGLSRVHHHMGRLAERSKDYTKAFEHHKQSLELKEALNDRVGMASSYHHLGNTYYGSRDLRLAHAMYEQALQFENEVNDHHGRANTLLQLAIVQSERFDWESALFYSFCAYQAWRMLGGGDPLKVAELRISTARSMVDNEVQVQVQQQADDALAEWGLR